jgi:hypothetical protein
MLAGEISQRSLVNRPELMNPALVGAYNKEAASGVRGAYDPLVKTPTGKAGPSAVAKGPLSAMAPSANGKIGTSAISASNAALQSNQSASKTGGSDWVGPGVRQAANSVAPGAMDEADSERHYAIRRIFADIGANPNAIQPGMTPAQIETLLPTPGLKKAYNKGMVEYDKWASDDMKEISGKVAPLAERLNSYRRLGQDIQMIQVLADKVSGGDVDNLLSSRTSQVLGTGNVKKVREWLASSGAKNVTEKQAAEVDRAVTDFKQALAGNINAYVKSTSGSAVNPSEALRIKDFISGDHSFGSIKNFQRLTSGDLQSEFETALGSAKSARSKVKWKIMTGISPQRGLDFSGIEKPNEASEGFIYNVNAGKVPTDHNQGSKQSEANYESDTKRAIESLKKMGLKQGPDGRYR